MRARYTSKLWRQCTTKVKRLSTPFILLTLKLYISSILMYCTEIFSDILDIIGHWQLSLWFYPSHNMKKCIFCTCLIWFPFRNALETILVQCKWRILFHGPFSIEIRRTRVIDMCGAIPFVLPILQDFFLIPYPCLGSRVCNMKKVFLTFRNTTSRGNISTGSECFSFEV